MQDEQPKNKWNNLKTNQSKEVARGCKDVENREALSPPVISKTLCDRLGNIGCGQFFY